MLFCECKLHDIELPISSEMVLLCFVVVVFAYYLLTANVRMKSGKVWNGSDAPTAYLAVAVTTART